MKTHTPALLLAALLAALAALTPAPARADDFLNELGALYKQSETGIQEARAQARAQADRAWAAVMEEWNRKVAQNAAAELEYQARTLGEFAAKYLEGDNGLRAAIRWAAKNGNTSVTITKSPDRAFVDGAYRYPPFRNTGLMVRDAQIAEPAPDYKLLSQSSGVDWSVSFDGNASPYAKAVVAKCEALGLKASAASGSILISWEKP